MYHQEESETARVRQTSTRRVPGEYSRAEVVIPKKRVSGIPGEYQQRWYYLATIFFTSVTAHLDVSERRSDWGSLIPISNVDKKKKTNKNIQK